MRSIAKADKIVLLKDGVIAESGSPDELIQKSGLFAKMCELQNGSSNWTLK